MFLLPKGGYFFLSIVLQVEKLIMHKCKTIVSNRFGSLLFTTVFVVQCIVIIIVIMKVQNLLLAQKSSSTANLPNGV